MSKSPERLLSGKRMMVIKTLEHTAKRFVDSFFSRTYKRARFGIYTTLEYNSTL